MAAPKKVTVKEYFEKNNKHLIKFGERFARLLTDENLVISYAEKDLEKLAKVWKLVIEMLDLNTKEDSIGKLAELITAYNEMDDETDGEE